MIRRTLITGSVAAALLVGGLVVSGAAGPLVGAAATGSTAGSPAGVRQPEGRPAPLAGEITVLAAASLAEAFEDLAAAFEDAHPDAQVHLVLGPSSSLAAQVAAGAPADVLATADERTMATALDAEPALSPAAEGAEPAVEPVVFARNTLAIAVPHDDPAQVDDLADLGRGDVVFAMCAEVVPCGAAARQVLVAAGVGHDPATFEGDVSAVLTKVALGEVDAGIVYASDVRPTAPAVADGSVEAVAIDDRLNVTTSYPIAVLGGSGQRQLAEAFVAHVVSAEGQQTLADAGFLRP